jgi:hypothetical protein
MTVTTLGKVLRKTGLGAVVLLALLVTHVWADRLTHSYNTYKFQRTENHRLGHLLDDLRQQLCLKVRYVEKFKNSASFRSYLVREHMGLVAPNEYVVRFVKGETTSSARE